MKPIVSKFSHPRQDGGYALLSAVLLLAVLIIFIADIDAITIPRAEQVRYDLERSQAEAYADSVITVAAMSLMDKRVDRRPRVDGMPSSISLLGHQQTVVIQDEFGKVDLNQATHLSISALFQGAGASILLSDEIADEIVAWRVETMGTSLNHNVFYVENELLMFPKITETLFNRVLPGITLFSHRGDIDRSVAPYEALLAIPGMDVSQARAIIDSRLNGGSEDGNAAGAVSNGRVVAGANQFGWPFRINARFEGRLASYQVDAVVQLGGGRDRPFVVLRRLFGGAPALGRAPAAAF